MSVDEDQVNVNPPQVELDARRLIKFLSRYPAIAVAFSGGVDSSVVPQRAAAVVTCGSCDRCVTKCGSVAVGTFSAIASQVAVEHWVVETHEISLPEYQRNDSQSAFVSKRFTA